MRVIEIMTGSEIQYCSPETMLHQAAKMMKKANCGALPVVDENNKVVGLVTDRDICLSLAHRHTKTLPERNVGDIITAKVYSVKTDDELTEALKQMRTNRVSRLPVVDKDGKLRGILSLHDLLSKALNGHADLGSVADSGENIAKTIRALIDRYSHVLQHQAKEVTAGRRISWEEAM